jgi:hypothetical protein
MADRVGNHSRGNECGAALEAVLPTTVPHTGCAYTYRKKATCSRSAWIIVARSQSV